MSHRGKYPEHGRFEHMTQGNRFVMSVPITVEQARAAHELGSYIVEAEPRTNDNARVLRRGWSPSSATAIITARPEYTLHMAVLCGVEP